jgi:site-specific recombinase XerC
MEVGMRRRQVTRREALAARRAKQSRLDCKIERPDRPKKMALAEFAEHYKERRRRGEEGRGYMRGAPKLDERTIVEHDMTLRYLIQHFGQRRGILSITVNDADAWVTALANGKLKAARRARQGLGLSEQRVRAHIRNVKAIFNWARRFGLVTDNPFTDFDGAPRPTGPNHYVPLVDFVRLLRACRRGAEIQHGWRALYGLCRLAGLRRGEALELPWSGKAVDSRGQEHWVGVDWERRRLHVMGNAKRSRTHRVVPICPRLYRILVRAFEAAPAGQATVCGLSGHNLTHHADEHIARAGLTRWPKIYQAMRSSCENDWKQAAVAEPTYCTWLGHSSQVSRKHYVSPTDAEFAAVSAHTQ